MASEQHTESRSHSPPDPSKTNFRELLNMSVNNPYAQAWLGGSNSGQAAPPSIFGALPFAAPSEQSPLLAFQFTALNPDILNCIVLGPNARHCFSISTSAPTFGQPAMTAIRNDKNEVVAKVEWHQRPVVEVKDMVPRCLASQFLPLSQDLSYVLFFKPVSMKCLTNLPQLSYNDCERKTVCLDQS